MLPAGNPCVYVCSNGTLLVVQGWNVKGLRWLSFSSHSMMSTQVLLNATIYQILSHFVDARRPCKNAFLFVFHVFCERVRTFLTSILQRNMTFMQYFTVDKTWCHEYSSHQLIVYDIKGYGLSDWNIILLGLLLVVHWQTENQMHFEKKTADQIEFLKRRRDKLIKLH